MTNAGKSSRSRGVGGKHKHAKNSGSKQVLRGKFEERHIDQVWEDIRKPPQLVHNTEAGPSGTTAR